MSSYRLRENSPDRQGHPVAASEEHPSSDAAQSWQTRVQPGMYAIGSDGSELGQVKEVRPADFLLDRAIGRTAEDSPIYVPFERIQAMLGDRVTLDIDAADLDTTATPLAPFGRLEPSTAP